MRGKLRAPAGDSTNSARAPPVVYEYGCLRARARASERRVAPAAAAPDGDAPRPSTLTEPAGDELAV